MLNYSVPIAQTCNKRCKCENTLHVRADAYVALHFHMLSNSEARIRNSFCSNDAKTKERFYFVVLKS